MNLLYCDESNLEERPGEFLVYAGVSIPAENTLTLSSAIAQLREQQGIDADAILKFAPPLPPLGHEEYRQLKQDIIETAIEAGCRLHAYVVLHDLARDPDQARRFGINTLCWHFQCALNRLGEMGLVLIDRFNDQGNQVDAHLREKMASGVEIPHRGNEPLDRIVGFHYSAIGQSHFASLSDILVGSLRWAINVHSRDLPYRENALQLLELLSPLFWREQGRQQVPDIGFCFSPFHIRSPVFHERYTALQDFLREGSVDSVQRIRFVG